MKRVLLPLLVAMSFFCYSQNGNYFLSNYSPGKDHFNHVCFDMSQDMRGVMYFATQSGVLEFDGREWDYLKGESAVYALQLTDGGNMFWAGAKGFGEITYDKDGFQHLSFISEPGTKDFFQTAYNDDNVYFLKDDGVYVFNVPSRKLSSLPSTELTGLFTNIFELHGKVYVNTLQAGVYAIENGKFTQTKLQLDAEIAFTAKLGKDYIAGSATNNIFIARSDGSFQEIVMKDAEYLNASVIVNATVVNDQLVALGTLRGGVVFIDPNTGKTEEIVNYDTGLPDNEVFAIITDRSKDVWVAHDYGFSRIAPFMPLRSFSHYNGLKGNLLCAYSIGGSAYVGTSLGLYKLQKEDVYDEIIYYVDVPVTNSSNSARKPDQAEPIKQQKEVAPAPESKKKGFFSFLKRKKNAVENKGEAKSSEDASSSTTPASDTRGQEAPPRFKREKRTQRILRASQNVYAKVAGIDAKVSMLHEINGTLIASGLGGMYEVTELKATPILEKPIRFVYASQFHNMLFAATYDNQVESVVKTPEGWKEISFLEDLDDQIDFIFEGSENEVWICGLTNIFQVGIKDQAIDFIHDVEIPNPDVESTFGVRAGEKILFANGSGFYTFDHADDRVEKVDSLPRPAKYFASEGHIFYRDTHGWHVSGTDANQANLHLLNLFPDLRFFSSDHESGNFWLISGSNDLYRFFTNKIDFNNEPFPLFVKSIHNDNKRTGRLEQLNFIEDKSAVVFEITQPDFISPDAIEYRYKLDQMNEKWSEWSSKNTIDFPYLPPGEYELKAQSRNVFGKVVDLAPVRFEVLPPYWKRSWFYAMEFAILASLVLLSFRLNTRYRIVSRILSLLTIILLIEFIQTLISSTIKLEQQSPVFDFIIQVCIALMILPVEGFLRNLMIGTLEGNNRFANLLVGKANQKQFVVQESEEFQPADDE